MSLYSCNEPHTTLEPAEITYLCTCITSHGGVGQKLVSNGEESPCSTIERKLFVATKASTRSKNAGG